MTRPSPTPAIVPDPRPRPRKAWSVQVITALSAPVLAFVLLLACLWTLPFPDKRRRLLAARERLSERCSWYVALWVFALVLLERWPLLVVAILAAGATIGVLFSGASAIPLALASAIAGASLAPVFAKDLPAWLFPRF